MDIKEQHNLDLVSAEIEEKLPSIALALHIYYLALVKEGFSTEQAILLVAEHGLTFGIKN